MKLGLYLSFFLLTLLSLGNKSLSLTDYKIKKICEKVKRELTCIRDLEDKRSNLQKGNYIEIPVKTYKR